MKKLPLVLSVLLLAGIYAASLLAQGHVMSPCGLRLLDEGTPVGCVTDLNAAGTGIVATVVGGNQGVLTVSVPITETEVDFGTSPVYTSTFSITDAGVSATSKILITQSGKAATGRQADENEMDFLSCNAEPAAGSFTLKCGSLQGPVAGLYKIGYTVG